MNNTLRLSNKRVYIKSNADTVCQPLKVNLGHDHCCIPNI